MFVDDSLDKRLEDEVQRYRDLLDEANRQISSMSNSELCSLSDFLNLWMQGLVTIAAAAAASDGVTGDMKIFETHGNLEKSMGQLVKLSSPTKWLLK